MSNPTTMCLLAERDATIERLQDHKATLIRLIEDMSNEIADRADENTKLQAALDAVKNDRASIVAFLLAESAKFSAAEAEDVRAGIPLRADRLGCKASILRTMAAYVAHGDDRQGGE